MSAILNQALTRTVHQCGEYCGLALPEGRLTITIVFDGDLMTMTWLGMGSPARIAPQSSSDGFGSKLEKASVTSLHGRIERHWLDRGLEIVLQFPLDDLNR